MQWKRVGETNIGDGLTDFKVEKRKAISLQPGGMLKNHSLLRARPLRDILGRRQSPGTTDGARPP